MDWLILLVGLLTLVVAVVVGREHILSFLSPTRYWWIKFNGAVRSRLWEAYVRTSRRASEQAVEQYKSKLTAFVVERGIMAHRYEHMDWYIKWPELVFDETEMDDVGAETLEEYRRQSVQASGYNMACQSIYAFILGDGSRISGFRGKDNCKGIFPSFWWEGPNGPHFDTKGGWSGVIMVPKRDKKGRVYLASPEGDCMSPFNRWPLFYDEPDKED